MLRVFSKSAVEEGPTIDLTPLLNIVFIMLIFCMVMSTLVEQPDASRPPSQAAAPAGQFFAPIQVAITADNQIWVNRKRVEFDEVRRVVEELRIDEPKAFAAVQADPASEAHYLIETLNQIKAAGVADISVSTRDLE